MTRVSSSYDLFDRHEGRLVECTLFRDIAANNVLDFKEKWLPVFDAKKQELKTEGKYTVEALKEFGLQDSHWKWPEKAAYIENHGGYIGFSVECSDVTQGLMILSSVGFAREESQKDEPLVQVELLSTAPWNRKNLVESAKFKGVGELLLQAAVAVSFEFHNEGRIGLHALSGAEAWYRDYCGMTDLGFDANKNMHYFEMTSSQAKAFIS